VCCIGGVGVGVAVLVSVTDGVRVGVAEAGVAAVGVGVGGKLVPVGDAVGEGVVAVGEAVELGEGLGATGVPGILGRTSRVASADRRRTITMAGATSEVCLGLGGWLAWLMMGPIITYNRRVSNLPAQEGVC